MKKHYFITSIALILISAGLSYGQNTSPWPALGNIGIGTTNPDNTLHLNSNSSYSGLKVSINDNNSPNWFDIAMARNNGNFSALALANDVVFRAAPGLSRLLITNSGYNSTVFATGGFGNETERMVITVDGNIGIGKSDPTDKLEVNGRIHARSVKVDLDDWPDYVFLPEYTLPSLQEVAQFIQQNGHLENVPSAEEIVTEGLDLGAMDKILMEKVEELTLYLIEKDEEIEKIKEEKGVLALTLEELIERVKLLERKLN
ncbi:MAG: hypothetical protein ACI9Y7_000866 [Dokdonia sp.]|jgi:hypothetical protein